MINGRILSSKRSKTVLSINVFKLIVLFILSVGYGQTLFRFYNEESYFVLHIVIEMIFIPISLLLSFMEAELIGSRYKIWLGVVSFSIPVLMLGSFLIDFTEEVFLISHLICNVFCFLLVVGFMGYIRKANWTQASNT